MPAFIEPTASGPGGSGKALPGSVSNPGVKTVAIGEGNYPRCPSCGQPALKVHMNKPKGQRVYCSNKNCSYDTSAPNDGVVAGDIKVVSRKGSVPAAQGGVKILTSHGRSF